MITDSEYNLCFDKVESVHRKFCSLTGSNISGSFVENEFGYLLLFVCDCSSWFAYRCHDELFFFL